MKNFFVRSTLWVHHKLTEKSRLRKEVRRLDELTKALMEPKITAMELQERGLLIAAKADLIGETMVTAFYELLDENKADNFAEMTYNWQGKTVIVTVQRVPGKTPANLLKEAKNRITELEAELKTKGSQ